MFFVDSVSHLWLTTDASIRRGLHGVGAPQSGQACQVHRHNTLHSGKRYAGTMHPCIAVNPRLPHNPSVVGSMPTRPTIIGLDRSGCAVPATSAYSFSPIVWRHMTATRGGRTIERLGRRRQRVRSMATAGGSKWEQ